MELDLKLIKEVVSSFAIEGECLQIEPLKLGHINDTYIGKWTSGLFIHQRINKFVFPNIPELMSNLVRVLDHVESKITTCPIAVQDTAVRLVKTKFNEYFYLDTQGEYWRTYEHVPNAQSILFCKDESQALEAAKACGRFQQYLWDLDPKQFHVVIKDFHNAKFRFANFKKSVNADKLGRVSEISKEIDFLLSRESEANSIMQAIESGALVWRVTHNDIKFNNVLFDKDSGLAKAVVDLDLCMPGSVLFDFGDLVRSSSVPTAEDEKDLTKVAVNLSYFEAIAQGYVGQLSHLLSPVEWDLMAAAPKIVTLTLAVRFLTDYIDGDLYFKTAYTDHNLVRTKNQLAVVRSMEENYTAMSGIISNLKNNA